MKKTPNTIIPLKQWSINISIIKNSLLWVQLLVTSLLSSSYILFLLVGLNLFEQQWEDIPASFMVALTISGGLFAALSLVTLIMLRHGIATVYVLKDEHIEQHTLSSRAKKTAGLFGLLAMFSGSNAGYTVAGASLLARSREQIAVKWSDVVSLDVFPKNKEIHINNEWHTTMQVVCPAESFESIVQFIRDKTLNQTQQKQGAKNKETPFAFKVMLSFLSLIFGLFLLPRLPIHYVGIFSIASTVFALFSLWSSGLKQRIFAAILSLLPIIGCTLAFIMGEVDMQQSGAIYALFIELILLGFFQFLGLGIVFKYIK